MQQYLRNTPPRRFTYCKSGVFKLWLVALVVMGMMAFTQAAYAALIMKFDQSAYTGDLWLQIQKDPTLNFTATYANGTKSIDFTDNSTPPKTLLMSKPVKLLDIGPDGLNIVYANSAHFYVFYDNPTGNARTAAPAFMTSLQRFQDFEVTMQGGTGDYGNLTAINYFTAPLSLRSYDASQNLLQQAGWGRTASQIGAQFATASGGNSQVVVKNAGGKVIRYLGPSNFTSVNPWPSFLPYTQSINQAGQSTTISPDAQGFHFKNEPLPVYQFGTVMTATVGADGSLNLTGSITASVNGSIKSGNPALPAGGAWTGATMTFSTTDINAFNSAIYGSVQTSAVTVTGWDAFLRFCRQTLQDPSKPHDPNTNPSLNDYVAGQPLNAYNTALNTLVGEVATGLLCGFINSDYQPGGVPPAIKNMPSNQWWTLNPPVAGAVVQPLHPYYDPYNNVVFNDAQNTVYGVPYSDRFKNASNSPAVYTVQYTDKQGMNHAVASWVVGIGAPLPGTTALPGMLLMLMGN